MSDKEKNAVVLLSGGLDSATAAAVAKNEGYNLYALTVNYQQRHAVELRAAKAVAQFLKVTRHEFIELDLRAFGHSALTDDIPVPKGRDESEMSDEIPQTYVPARNTIFLSLALAYAETVNAFDIFAGMNAVDYSGYPDCRPDFIRAFETLANQGTKAAVEGQGEFHIQTPLILLSKADIIRLGTKLKMDYSLTHSCYDPDSNGAACGDCDSCLLRKKGFEEAGVPDPTLYSKK